MMRTQNKIRTLGNTFLNFFFFFRALPELPLPPLGRFFYDGPHRYFPLHWEAVIHYVQLRSSNFKRKIIYVFFKFIGM